jgi:hypothetical protein
MMACSRHGLWAAGNSFRAPVRMLLRLYNGIMCVGKRPLAKAGRPIGPRISPAPTRALYESSPSMPVRQPNWLPFFFRASTRPPKRKRPSLNQNAPCRGRPTSQGRRRRDVVGGLRVFLRLLRRYTYAEASVTPPVKHSEPTILQDHSSSLSLRLCKSRLPAKPLDWYPTIETAVPRTRPTWTRDGWVTLKASQALGRVSNSWGTGITSPRVSLLFVRVAQSLSTVA